jgi:hypothetical protein
LTKRTFYNRWQNYTQTGEFMNRIQIISLMLIGFSSFCCTKEAKDYSGKYIGKAEVKKNRRCFNCPIEDLDTVYNSFQVIITSNRENKDWDLVPDFGNGPTASFDHVKINNDQLSAYYTDPSTTTTSLEGHFSGDSLTVVEDQTTFVNQYQFRMTLLLKKH